MNAGNKNTLSAHHPQRRNVTSSMVRIKKQKKNKTGHTRTNLTQSGEPQRYSWERRRRLCHTIDLLVITWATQPGISLSRGPPSQAFRYHVSHPARHIVITWATQPDACVVGSVVGLVCQQSVYCDWGSKFDLQVVLQCGST